MLCCNNQIWMIAKCDKQICSTHLWFLNQEQRARITAVGKFLTILNDGALLLALFGSEHIYLYIMFILKLDQFVMLLSYETVYRYMRCDCKNRCMRCYWIRNLC